MKAYTTEDGHIVVFRQKRRFDMKTKKKRIAQEIQSRILTIVIAIFMVVAVVVAVMVGNVSLSAQKNDLEMQSKAASYQLEIFFQEYMTIVEQMALDKDVRTLLTETKAGDKITESADYQTVFHEMEKCNNLFLL